jgi:replication factor C small subunit
MPISDSPWVFKYSPKKLEDVLGDPNMLAKFKEFIDKKDLQHLLFCGRPGTGKSTCAKLLAKEITSDGNILYINASEEKGIDTLRNKVADFCSMSAFGKLRVVIFDEFDGMSWQSMEAMRNTMEEYITNSRFILTCNYERKIIEPIKSRCQMWTFTADEKKQKVAIIRRCIEILIKENVSGPDVKKDVVRLVNKFYPDIRRTINALQKLTVNKVFTFSDELATNEYEEKLLSYLREMNIKAIREEILGNVDYNDMYRILFYKAGDIHVEKKLQIMTIIGDATRWHSIVLDPEINFVTCLLKICEEINRE